MTVAGVPGGYRRLSPYLVVEDAEGLLAFVASVFETEVRRRTTGEAGGLHAEVELGDSVLMNTGTPDELDAWVAGVMATLTAAETSRDAVEESSYTP